MAEKNLILFQIGPVQDFIAAARRSRDLWYGSRLLSELSKVAVAKLEELSPGSVFSPAQNIASSPNIIFALGELNANSLKKVEDAVCDNLLILAKTTFDQVKAEFHRSIAETHVRDLLEVYWVLIPVANENDEKEFGEATDRAMHLMAARKTTRDFLSAEGSEADKSSIDGNRECVIPKERYSGSTDPDKEKKIRSLYDDFHARRGERLSGVDLMKRLGTFIKTKPENTTEADFPSTSHFAAQPFIQVIREDKTKDLNKLISDIRDLLKSKGGIGVGIQEADEGSLLFESRLVDYLPDPSQVTEVVEKFNALFKEAMLGDLRPGSYYVVLAADGDNMGVVIDGHKNKRARLALSQALGAFSTEAEGIIESYHGRAIYSGGDDFLAYLPLDSALACAADLEQGFKNATDNFGVKKNGGEIRPTLSVGIAIAHHLDPLSDTLRLAREAEHAAKHHKGFPEKNGLAITLSKRSGADRTIVGLFHALHDRLTQMIGWTVGGDISAAAAYDLRELHRRLSQIPELREGLIQETVRILGRKRRKGGAEEDEQLKAVKKKLRGWLQPQNGDGQAAVSIDELANELIVANAFGSARISPLSETQKSEETIP